MKLISPSNTDQQTTQTINIRKKTKQKKKRKEHSINKAKHNGENTGRGKYCLFMSLRLY